MHYAHKLTAVKITRLTKPGRYGDGGGLYLRVAAYRRRNGEPARSKNWIFRYRYAGRTRWMGLGAIHALSLAQARVLARDYRVLLVQGIDPIEARLARRRGVKLEAARTITFRQCAERYITAHRAGWRSAAHAAQWPATLSAYVYPTIGELPVGSIDTALVMQCLEPLWHRAPATAMRVRGRIEVILDWAKARDFRSGENPARWRGHLANLLPAHHKLQRHNHQPALPYAEAPTFMAELRRRDDIAARALEFAILTAARRNEIIGARWSEVDLNAKLWAVPAERMKSGRGHVAPLSDRAVEVLQSLDRVHGCDFAFPGAKLGRPIGTDTLMRLLRELRPGVTMHGFRSTFRDWAGDCTHHQRDVVEAALAHRIENAVEAAYRRSTALEKRARLMADWSRFLAQPATMEGDKVVALAR
jgi:integrase